MVKDQPPDIPPNQPDIWEGAKAIPKDANSHVPSGKTQPDKMEKRWTRRFVMLSALILAIIFVRYLYPRVSTHPYNTIYPDGKCCWAAFMPDGRQILSASTSNGQLLFQLWDVKTGSLLKCIKRQTEDDLRDAGVSPDGKTLMAAVGDEILMWNLQTSEEELRLSSRHQNWLEKSVKIPILPSVKRGWASHEEMDKSTILDRIFISDWRGPESDKGNTIGSIVFSEEPDCVAIKRWNGTVQLWNYRTGALLNKEQGSKYLNNCAISPDCALIADGPNIINSFSGNFVRVLEGYGEGDNNKIKYDSWGEVVFDNFSPDGKSMVTGHPDGRISLWDIGAGHKIREFSHRVPPYREVGQNMLNTKAVFSPDGALIATTADDGDVKLWDVATGRLMREYQWINHIFHSVQFSHDGSFLMAREDIAHSDNPGLYIWKLNDRPSSLENLKRDLDIQTRNASDGGNITKAPIYNGKGATTGGPAPGGSPTQVMTVDLGCHNLLQDLQLGNDVIYSVKGDGVVEIRGPLWWDHGVAMSDIYLSEETSPLRLSNNSRWVAIRSVNGNLNCVTIESYGEISDNR